MPQGEYLQYGGQAIVEGVMMRSPRHFSVACRAPNGEIVERTEPLETTWIGRQKWLKKPFLRGSLALFDAMALGIKAMRFASNVQLDPRYQPANAEEATTTGNGQPAASAPPSAPSRIQDLQIGGAMVFGVLLGLGLFVYLPNLLAQTLQRAGWSGTSINLVAGLLKIVIFFGYILLIARMEAIKEVFRYHGAEHKAINALEADLPLTLENCRAQTRLHPRCGTSFAIIVLLISVLIFTFIPRYPLGESANLILNTTVRVFVELLILPLIAGLAYEIIRIAGRFKTTTAVKTLLWPGLMSQYLTTREPADKHIEVALAALRNVVRAEEGAPTEPPEEEVEAAAAQIA